MGIKSDKIFGLFSSFDHPNFLNPIKQRIARIAYIIFEVELITALYVNKIPHINKTYFKNIPIFHLL